MRFFWGHIIVPLIETNSTIMLREFPRLCMILFVNMWDCSSISNLRMWWEGECRLFVRLFLWPEPLPSSLPACPTPHTFWIISEKATRGKLTLFKVFTERLPCVVHIVYTAVICQNCFPSQKWLWNRWNEKFRTHGWQQSSCSDILCQIQTKGDCRRHRQELMRNL